MAIFFAFIATIVTIFFILIVAMIAGPGEGSGRGMTALFYCIIGSPILFIFYYRIFYGLLFGKDENVN